MSVHNLTQAREDARRAHHAAEASRHRGVCLSGFGPSSFVAKTAAQVASQEAARLARIDARAETPEGRFKDAAWKIAVGIGDDRLLKIADRGVAGEIEFASRLLAGMSGPLADDASEALIEIAVAHLGMAAE